MPISRSALHWRAEMLEEALDRGGRYLEPQAVERGHAVVSQVMQRTAISGSRTVVALAGATGSGKSSLFNALVGAQVAVAGPLRPTTSRPTAGVFGAEDAAELLSWLDVDRRHHTADPQLDGLVLLDLPDVDSREVSHRVEADRILALADLFVWVTDPQKYADARLHDDYLRPLRAHGATMVVVLNQVDRLHPEDVPGALADLRRLLEQDGIQDARVIGTSALTGAGLKDLRWMIEDAVASNLAAEARLIADIQTVAQELRAGVADDEASVSDRDAAGLVEALARAAGVPTVLQAVYRDHLRQATAHGGHPLVRWMRRFRPDPLRRLRLPSDRDGVTVDDFRQVLGRSSLPPATPAARASVQLAAQSVAHGAGAGLPVPWLQAVDHAADPRETDLADALDQAVMGTPLRERSPLWWSVANVMQWLLVLSLVVGLAWLGLLYALDFLATPGRDLVPYTPSVGPVPLPSLLAVVGGLGGVLVTLLSRWAARVGAARRRRRVEKRLRGRILAVARAQVLDPVRDVLARHRETREQLEAAAR